MSITTSRDANEAIRQITTATMQLCRAMHRAGMNPPLGIMIDKESASALEYFHYLNQSTLFQKPEETRAKPQGYVVSIAGIDFRKEQQP